MIISIIYLFVCLVLEMLMSNFFTSTLSDISVFATIYTIIGLVILYPYFNCSKKYYLLVIMCGVIFDILYASTYMFNLVLFGLVGILVNVLYSLFPENVFMTNLISFISVLIYHVLCYILLSLFSDISYSFIILVNIIVGSIIMTIIYTTISYYVIRFVFNRRGIKYIK